LAVALAGTCAAPAAADAPLGLTDCGPAEGVEVCSGLVKTWDGVPLDTTVVLPANAPDRPLPLVAEVHGFGNSKYEYLNPDETAYTDNAYAWARDGYAVLNFTARGLWGSCGTPDSRLADPTGCAAGYIHLADVRYEVRDIQELIGRLVDERVADPARIGVTGDSYGGGQTLMLAALRDRVMLPDGSLIPWRSPEGTPLQIAAAAPVIPWTDLVSAAAPNGRVSSTGITPRSLATNPVGVEKASVVNAIFAAAQFATGPGQPTGEPFVPGRPMGFIEPTGLDPDADVTAWVSRTSAGEPYDDASTKAIVDTLARFHSAYYVPADHRPPPLFLASGLTDDLFPADEVLRFANRTAQRYPSLPMSILLGDFGHQRASNEPAERRLLLRSVHRWFDHYLLGRGGSPRTGVTAFAQTCPRDAPAGARYRAAHFADLARGAVHLRGKQTQTVSSTGLDPVGGAALDPVAGMGDGCAIVGPGDPAGSASYSRKVSAKRPLTLIGSPTIRARLTITGAPPTSTELAARLFDVSPDGSKHLVARGLYRPDAGPPAVWHLHPAAWTFAPGHTIELQLLGADPPYSRPANSAFETAVSHLRLTVPVRQRFSPGRAR
jgi:dienelactone hydrolase